MPSVQYYKIALKLTTQSSHKKHKMAAVVVRGGAILSKATNTPLWGGHAEKRALQCLNQIKANGATIYIARLSGGMSRPCAQCLNRIRTIGIKYIVYADWRGKLTFEKL